MSINIKHSLPATEAIQHAWDMPRTLVFLAVVDHGSFSAAARALSLSRGAVSAHIKALEKVCRVRLFERNTRKVNLTQAGAAFLPCALELRRSWTEGLEALQAQLDEPTGTLVVTAPSLLERPLLSPAVVEYVRKYDRVRVDVRLTDSMLNVIEQGIDIALRTGPLPDSDLVTRRLSRDREVVVGAPSLFAGRRAPEEPKNLAAWPWLGHRGLSMSRELYGPDGRRNTIEFKPRVVADTAIGLKNLLVAGAGLALFPAFAIRDELRAGALVRVLPKWSAREFGIYAVVPSKRHQTPRVSLFIDLLVGHAMPTA